MFQKFANNNRIVWLIFGWSFAGLAFLFALGPVQDLITLLNGILAGSLFGILFAYWRLAIATVVGAPPFDRARQYALSVFILWIVIAVLVFGSIWTRSSGVWTPPYFYAVAIRYGAIIAAWMQVTAPDFDEGFFSGKDRKVLWTAVLISTVSSLFFIFAQDQTILSN